jgi:hypothetical protein
VATSSLRHIRVIATDWSQDGKYLLYPRGPSGQYPEIWAMPLEGERKPWLVVPRNAPGSYADSGHLSPDGHWFAYMSGESGVPEVYVAAFRGGQAKWQVSTNGGREPQWSHDGKELYFSNYQAALSVFSVPVKEIGGGLQFGARVKLDEQKFGLVRCHVRRQENPAESGLAAGQPVRYGDDKLHGGLEEVRELVGPMNAPAERLASPGSGRMTAKPYLIGQGRVPTIQS